LKHAARPVFQKQFEAAHQTDQILSSETTDLIPPTIFNPQTELSSPALGLIIFPHYQVQSDFELQQLSRAQAGLELMQCLINARNLPEHGFLEITRLARLTPAFKMTYANFAQVEPHLDSFLKRLEAED
jgi:hypothetical protein